mgnify:CR=1 FL=1
MNSPCGSCRIGVFYDGNFLLHASNYYNYIHPVKRRLSLGGLHNFIRHRVAEEEGIEPSKCQIAQAHYFRGRLNAAEAAQRGNQLYNDRVFDDILMSEGIQPHYLPLRNLQGKKEERGIDVWLSLEAYELAMTGRIDTVVNGAAAFSPPTHDWAHITSEMIEDVMRVNIDSMLYSYQTVLRYMMKKKIRGSFLNFSSSTALAYNGSAVQGYPFSKACIKLATQNMVNQVSKKYGIRFNCLAPNYVWVPKQEKVWDMYREHFEATTPMPYVGMPEDAAWAVVYLCSDEAKYINGVCLPVDGGWAVQK